MLKSSPRSRTCRPRNSLLLILLAVITGALATGCGPADLDDHLDDITDGYRFSLAGWEFDQLTGELAGLFTTDPAAADTDEVAAYFNAAEQDPVMREAVTRAIENQVREAYQAAGITDPFTGWLHGDGTFPPVNIYLGEPPKLLIVSPRDHIERYREALLLPDLSLEDIEEIEAAVEDRGYSALVVNLGGVATYPSYVTTGSGLSWALKTAAEEWLHQYLAFTPLGFNYALYLTGVKRNGDIATMNETVAGIVSEEIGAAVYEQYYATDEETVPVEEPAFDFNAAMRKTRRTVDELLADGKIAEAEAYMTERRDYIQDNGYYIRKLNQAYFAFYGTYAASESSIDPIGEELKTLRSESGSLGEFLDTVVTLTSRDELAELVD